MPTSSSDQRNPLSVFAALVSIGAFLVAALAVVVVSTQSGTASGDSTDPGPPVAVSLSEFKIEPASIMVGKGGSLTVTNAGSQVHNLQVKGQGIQTSDLAAGASESLDLSALAPGTYTVVCTIAGHEAAGMVGTLTVSSGPVSASGETAAAGGSGGSHEHTEADYAEMERIHEEVLTEYATNALTNGTGVPTEGRGNEVLAPTPTTDGFKQFDLTAAITDWEVEPGKVVKAWTYNGMVPGPWIRVEPGDKVRVVLKNEMPAATDIHFHGITTPFYADGVATLTQPWIKPRETFTYEFVAPNRPEMGMYHAHAHGQEAVVNGLFAVFQVGDLDLSAARGKTFPGRADLPIPADLTITQEYPMVLNDAGVIGLSLNGKAYPATEPVLARVGDAVLVHYYNEGLQSHPMHLHHVPQLVVAKDGFPLESPYWADTINVSPGERYSVLLLPTRDDLALDFDGNVDTDGPTGGVGVWAFHCHILTHAEGDNGLMGMVTVLAVLPEEPAAG